MELPEVFIEVGYNYKIHEYSNPDLVNRTIADYYDWNTKRKNREDIKWLAWVDRAGVSTLKDRKNESSKNVELQFGAQYFVIEEDDEWVKLSDAAAAGNSLGWVHKSNMVLWSNPLVDTSTRIELKAFVINDAAQVSSLKDIEDTHKYELFTSPEGNAKTTKPRFIYDVLFIFKYEKAQGAKEGRYLVSPFFNLAQSRDQAFLGWVSENRIKPWETSLCLEPNWEPEAVKERRELGVEAKVLWEDQDLKEFIRSYQGESIIRSSYREPAQMDVSERMSKDVMRYPVFGGEMIGMQNCRFNTGAAAKLNEGNTSVALEEGYSDDAYIEWKRINDELKNNDKINIFFLLDATPYMSFYKKEIPGIVKALAEQAELEGDFNRIRYGAAVFRDVVSRTKEVDADVFQKSQLYNDHEDLMEWLDEVKLFKNGNEERRAAYFGLLNTIKGLPANSTNIVIQVSNAPDLMSLPTSMPGTGAVVQPLDIALQMQEAGLDFHFAHFTTYTPKIKERLREKLSEQYRNEVINEIRSFYSRRYQSLDWKEKGFNVAAPSLTQTPGEEYDEYTLKNSFFNVSEFYFHDFNTEVFSQLTIDFVNECKTMDAEFRETLKNLLSDPSTLKDKAGELNPYVMVQLKKVGDQYNPELFEDLLKQKTHLFFDGVTSYSVDEAEYPLFKYVLFVPENNLLAQKSSLTRLYGELNQGSADRSLEALREHYEEISETFLGNQNPSSMTYLELQEKILGIKELNIVNPFNTQEIKILEGITFRDLTNKRLDDKKLGAYKSMVGENIEKIKQILADEFYYEIEGTDSKFYWVPIEYYFK